MKGIKKVNFRDAHYDESTGVSVATVKCGNIEFIGSACFNPEDAEKGIKPSKMKGCYIAELRATKDALKWQLKEIAKEYEIANNILKACKQNKDYDPSAPVIHTLYAQVKEIKKKMIMLKTGIYDIDTALEKMTR